jgi:general secretion pathway protein N
VADTLRPASLVIGAIALWAMCVLLLAATGLGSRVPDSGVVATPPAIPKVALVPTRSRLGPLLDYAQVGQRPLLNTDRRPGPEPAAAGGSTDQLDVVLTSVLITPRLQLAILTDTKDQSSRRVRVGENVAGTNWRLASLGPRNAVLDGPSGQRTLQLRVYDGQGGTPPTAVAGSAPTPSSGTLGGAPARAGEGSGNASAGDAGGNAATAGPARNRPAVVNPAPPQSIPPTPQPTMQPQPTTQDAQIEAIRRRIEARRAQMRAEAEAAGAAQNR